MDVFRRSASAVRAAFFSKAPYRVASRSACKTALLSSSLLLKKTVCVTSALPLNGTHALLNSTLGSQGSTALRLACKHTLLTGRTSAQRQCTKWGYAQPAVRPAFYSEAPYQVASRSACKQALLNRCVGSTAFASFLLLFKSHGSFEALSLSSQSCLFPKCAILKCITVSLQISTAEQLCVWKLPSGFSCCA